MEKNANKTKTKDKNVFSKSKSQKKIVLFFLAVFVVLTFIFILSGQSKIYKEPNLVAFFKFDGKEGCEILDSSGNNHLGALKPQCPEVSPSWVAQGKEGTALKFAKVDHNCSQETEELFNPIEEERIEAEREGEGKQKAVSKCSRSGAYIEIPNSKNLNITDKITIDLWVKYSSDPRSFSGIILTKYSEYRDNPYSIYSNGVDGIKFITRDNFGKEYSVSFPLKDLDNWQNTWYNIVAVFDGKNMKIKVNGKEGKSVKAKEEMRISNGPLRIGALTSNDLQFEGIIDEVKIYNK